MPLSNWPIIDETEEQWMLEILRSGKWNWLGEHEREFCRAYAEFIGTRYCLCLSNGTVALQCALQPGRRYGHNYRITEMQACLLRGGLIRLAEQTARREENARYLADKLSEMGGPLRVARHDPRVTRQAYYCLTLQVDPAQLDGLTRDQYLKALQAEWIPVDGTYEPVYRNGLLNLYDRTSPIPFRDRKMVQNYDELRLPNTERAVAETGVTMNHVQLLGDREYMDQILHGVSKVNDHLEEVRRHFERQGDR